MRENVTVDKALNRGQLILIVVPLLTMTMVFGLLIYLIIKKIIDSPVYIPLMLVVGITSGWLVWSYNVVKWKVWAFENVRNVHELRRKAIDQKLIWPDGNWFNKSEIWAYEQKRKWKHIEKKFEVNDEYRDDFSIPKETKLYFSRVEIYLGFIIGPLLLFIPFYVFDGTKNYILIVGPFIGIYFIYRGFKKFKNRNQPQLILDDKGIYIEKFKNKFLWDRVIQVTVTVNKSGSYLNLFYVDEEALPLESFQEGEEDVEDTYALHSISSEINEYNMSVKKIEYRVYVYRRRFENINS